MALDLFANYERVSNGAVFYRTISADPHSVVFKLYDTQDYSRDLLEAYQAEYSLNESTIRYPMVDLQICQHFDRQVPNVSAVTVYVSSLNPTQYYQTFSISAIYVSSFPQANFVVYPTLRINEEEGTITTLNSTNFHESSGVYFYGEGHTETINLSSNYATAKWYVGNSLSGIDAEQQSSTPVTSLPDNKTATVSITSSPNLTKSYDVSLRVHNSEILENGPIYTYDDFTGIKSFYPFFCSTRHVSNSASELNSTLRNQIEVRPYPSVVTYELISQLSSTPTFLPYDYSAQRFLAFLQPTAGGLNFLTETFYGSKWKVESLADEREPNPDWSQVTSLLPSVTGYSFTLAYYNQNNIDDVLFKCSAGFNTNILTIATVHKSTQIDLAPNDWLCRTISFELTAEEVVVGIPTGRFYTSSFYYLTGEEIKIFNITEIPPDITLEEIVLYLDRQTPIAVDLSSEFITITYQDVGTVSLSAALKFKDANGYTRLTTTVLDNFIEIVPQYDEVEIASCQTFESLSEQYPKISPNEWVTDDNINSIFLKFDESLNNLRAYSKTYNTDNPIIGRLDPIESETGCSRDFHWLVPTINPNEFNNWTCPTENEVCRYVDLCRLNTLDKIVVAYKTELQLLDNNYQATWLSGHVLVDDVFKFINIVGIASTTTDMLAVLDSSIPRVSVYTIDKETNQFVLYSTWGRYGLSNSKTGFNKPLDIHVDQTNSVWICDTGNECVKQLTIAGRHISTIQSSLFQNNPPISLCVDSDKNIHCLTQDSIIFVFNQSGEFLFQYTTPENITGTKINTNYKRETVYIIHDKGILKYCKNGIYLNDVVNNLACQDQSGITSVISKFSNAEQDRYRNLYVVVNNTILKIIDRMVIDSSLYEGYSAVKNLWSLDSILIHKEEYIQPWVYLRSFHRMWDNIELFRNSLFYETEGCKSFQQPVYAKEDLVIGQNEIVTNATINRLSEQLWANILTLVKYFDPTCKNN